MAEHVSSGGNPVVPTSVSTTKINLGEIGARETISVSLVADGRNYAGEVRAVRLDDRLQPLVTVLWEKWRERQAEQGIFEDAVALDEDAPFPAFGEVAGQGVMDVQVVMDPSETDLAMLSGTDKRGVDEVQEAILTMQGGEVEIQKELDLPTPGVASVGPTVSAVGIQLQPGSELPALRLEGGVVPVLVPGVENRKLTEVQLQAMRRIIKQRLELVGAAELGSLRGEVGSVRRSARLMQMRDI